MSDLTGSHMDWDEYNVAFDADGALLDLYVLNTSLADWNTLMRFLPHSGYTLEFRIDNQVQSLPEDLTTLFANRAEQGVFMSVDLGGFTLHCHFFWDEEIEFDIEPREITGPDKAEALFEFMRRLGQALNKEVIVTDENVQQAILFRYSPETDNVSYVPGSRFTPEEKERLKTQQESYFLFTLRELSKQGGQLRRAGASQDDICAVALAAGLGRLGRAFLLDGGSLSETYAAASCEGVTAAPLPEYQRFVEVIKQILHLDAKMSGQRL